MKIDRCFCGVSVQTGCIEPELTRFFCAIHGREHQEECGNGRFMILPVAGVATVPDMVNAPPHYRGIRVTGRKLWNEGEDRACVEIEAIDIIEAIGAGFHLGAVLKYLLRAGKKGDAVEDLKKARWFLDRLITRTETGK